MKLLSYCAFLIFTFQSIATFSQQKVIVGDTGIVQNLGKVISNSSGRDPVCQFYPCGTDHINTSEFIVSSSLEIIGSQKRLIVTHLFIPQKVGVAKDTFSVWECSDFSELDNCIAGAGTIYESTVEGIDSMTTAKVVYPSVVMPIDTNNSQYLPNKIGAFFSMYNNVSDSSTYSNWQLIVSDSAKLTFKIDTAGTELTSYLMEPFTRKRQLNFTFTTELTPIETERVFSAKLLTTVTTAGKDSVFENALLFRFPPLQPKGVHDTRSEDVVSVSISPNPTDLNTTLSFGHNRSESVNIELYDVLGNRKMILADRIYQSGTHTIPIDTKDLSQGSYFVRLQSNGQVVTKKLIVQ